jgi:hypothetical protein
MITDINNEERLVQTTFAEHLEINGCSKTARGYTQYTYKKATHNNRCKWL